MLICCLARVLGLFGLRDCVGVRFLFGWLIDVLLWFTKFDRGSGLIVLLLAVYRGCVGCAFDLRFCVDIWVCWY